MCADCVRWASKKAGGSTRNGRKTAGRRLGLKCGDGRCTVSSRVVCVCVCVCVCEVLVV